MRKLAVLSIGLLIGMGAAVAPVMAQDSGVANTSQDFKSPEANDGIFGSDLSIFDVMRRAGSLGAEQVDDGFYRSQSRQIDRQAESLHERQRAIMQQRAAEASAAGASQAPSLDQFAQ